MSHHDIIRRAAQPRQTAAADTECFPNYWSIAFLDMDSDRSCLFEMYPGHDLDRAGVAKMLRNWRVVTFNGLHYDIPMIALAVMPDTTNTLLKTLNDDLIGPGYGMGLKSWEVYEKYGCNQLPSYVDHIDMMAVAPSAARKFGLKMYGCCMHSEEIVNLPYAIDQLIYEPERKVLRKYVQNDNRLTRDLWHEMQPQMKIRNNLTVKHGIDLRSKSDPQIAEAVIRKKVELAMGKKIYKPDVRGRVLRYEPHAFLHFNTPEMQKAYDTLANSKYIIRGDGIILQPPGFEGKVPFDDMTFSIGIGGLHSTENKRTLYSTDEVKIKDRDVRGYYPNQMIATGRNPTSMGRFFQPIFQGIVRDREVCKAAGDKDGAEQGKLMSNGTFGKTNSPHSVLYSPEIFIQTTVGGQLSLLMLIERLHLAGFHVVSANTDGIVTMVPVERNADFVSIVFDWECDTGLVTEEVTYESLHSRDVNDYVAIYKETDKKTGEVLIKAKRKGSFSKSGRGQPAALGLKKNPDAEVSSDAVVEFLLHGTPIHETIRGCVDIRKFIVAKQVSGGAEKDGVEYGKNIRWYYSDDCPGPILSASSGNKVSVSEGARLCMRLPDELPDDLDFEWYEREAYAIMGDIGTPFNDPIYAGRRGTVLGHLPEQKTMHMLRMPEGVAACGATMKTRREPWIEFTKLPLGHRYCAKCRKEFPQ